MIDAPFVGAADVLAISARWQLAVNRARKLVKSTGRALYVAWYKAPRHYPDGTWIVWASVPDFAAPPVPGALWRTEQSTIGAQRFDTIVEK